MRRWKTGRGAKRALEVAERALGLEPALVVEGGVGGGDVGIGGLEQELAVQLLLGGHLRAVDPQPSGEVTVEALTSKATVNAIGSDGLEELVGVTSLGGVEVLDVSEDGNSALVTAGLLNFAPSKPGGKPPKKPTNSTPATFAMTNEGANGSSTKWSSSV